jgi:hypothetical protein
MTTMNNAPLSRLDQIAARVDAAMKSALVCSMLLALPPDEGRTAHAKKEADKAKEAAGNALALLSREGARPAHLPAPKDIPLELLDTPENRELLAALDAVVALAEKVDAQRGRSLPESARLHPDDTLGVDLAEDLNQIRARVYMEVHGATGKGLE